MSFAFCPYTQPPYYEHPAPVWAFVKSVKPTLTQEDRDKGKRAQCAGAVGRQGKETQQSRQYIQSKHIPVTSASGLRGEDSAQDTSPMGEQGHYA